MTRAALRRHLLPLLVGLAAAIAATACEGVSDTNPGPPDASADSAPPPDGLTASDLPAPDGGTAPVDRPSPRPDEVAPTDDAGPPSDVGGPTCLTAGADCAAEDCCEGLACVEGLCAAPAAACLQPTEPCQDGDTCCGDARVCGTTSLGQVCCGNEGAACATANGEDCCGALLCTGGVCGTGGGGGGTTRFRAIHADASLSGVYVSAYFDHGGQDWSCGSVRYGGHQGNDFACKNGQACIDQGLDVVAGAAGEVIAKSDGAFDRCTDANCSPPNGNFVRLRHADGSTSWYLHMKQFSITVNVGDQVTCGQKLGQTASSGQSTGAHTHFHFNASENAAPSDPFGGACSQPESRWVNQQNHGSGGTGAGNDQLPAPTCQ